MNTLVQPLFARQSLVYLLSKLTPDQQPQWGRMSARHMVEHLAETLQYSNGTVWCSIYTPAERIPKLKQTFIDGNTDFPRGFVSPLNGNTLPPLRYPDLSRAIEQLLLEYDKFQAYFRNSPESTLPSPVFGELNFREWQAFHEKHFRYHFTQFSLL